MRRGPTNDPHHSAVASPAPQGLAPQRRTRDVDPDDIGVFAEFAVVGHGVSLVGLGVVLCARE